MRRGVRGDRVAEIWDWPVNFPRNSRLNVADEGMGFIKPEPDIMSFKMCQVNVAPSCTVIKEFGSCVASKH